MADTPTKTPKKLTELRVIDLRSQLEQRGLEKTGVKAALIERLKKALEDEGKNSDELVFDVSEKKTTPAKKINGSSDADQDKEKTADEEDVEDEVDETEDAEMVVPDIKVDNVKEEEKTEKMEVDKADTEVDVTPSEEPKAEEEMETEDAVMADAKVLDEVTDEDAINLTIEDEDKLLADDEDEEAVKTEEPKDAEKEKETDKPSEVNGDQGEDKSAKGDESNKENTEAAVNVNSEAGAENPPSPTSAPVPEPSLTTEDLLKLHTTADRKDDDISLVVHVDDTQNDLDNDLLGTPMKKTPTNASEDTDTPKGNEAADDATKASEETAKPAGDKKSVTPSAKKPAADQKKTPSAADAKKADGKKEDSTKKTPEKKADGKKDVDKKDDKAKSDSKSASKTSSKDDRSKDSSSSSSSRNLWVSGLSSATRATDLKTLFSKHGKVVGAKVVTNPRSPGSRCYGFVTMSTTEEASRCIQHLHRTELHGRMISVERGNVTLQAKNEPSVHPPSSRSSRPTSSRDDRRVPKKDDKAAEKKDTKPSEKKDTKPTEKKDEKKDEGKKDEAKKDEKKDPEKKPDAKKAEGDKKEEKKDGEKKEEEKKDGEKKDEKKDGEKKDDRSSHRHSSSRHSASSDRRSDGRRPADSRDKRDQQKKEDVLSFQKIKAERERERLKQQERRLREEERRRARDLERERQRQREIARQQKEEADRLQRERDKIRMERERLERERIAMERADREGRMERERRERERIERERDEARRLTQLRMEQDRRPAKRTYDRGVGAARDSRDDQYWQTEPKRPALAADRPFNSGSNFSDNRGFGDFGGPARGGYEDTMDRRVERYDRKDARPIDSGARHTDTGRFDSHREDPAVRRGRDPIPSRDTGPSRDRDDRRTFDDRRPERTATADRSFERYDDRGLTTRDTDRRGAVPERRDTDRRDTDRRVSPDRRQDVRNDWKTDSRGMSTTGRDSHRPAYDAGMKGSTASSREPWVDSRKDSWPSSSLDSQNLSRGQTDRWANTASTDRTMSTMRGSQHSSSSLPLSTPLLATPSNNQSFLTSAANIMMGVGMAGNRSTQDDRYNAYKNISGGSVRRY